MAKTTSLGILGVAMMLLSTHTMAHALLVGHTAVGAILGPTTQLAPSIGASCDFGGWQKPSTKADQLTI